MPNIAELIKILAKITKSDGEIWMSKIVLDYAYGLAKLFKEASEHYVFSIVGGDFTGHYRFKQGFDGLSDIPTVLQEHVSKLLNFKTPVWIDQECELREILSKLQNAGFRANE